MENLLMNPQWCPGPDGNPKYFSMKGITFNRQAYYGNRTCSISRPANAPSPCCIAYDSPLVIAGKAAVLWGFNIRAMEAVDIELVADFYDEEGEPLKTFRHPIAHRLTPNFKMLTGCFPVWRVKA